MLNILKRGNLLKIQNRADQLAHSSRRQPKSKYEGPNLYNVSKALFNILHNPEFTGQIYTPQLNWEFKTPWQNF